MTNQTSKISKVYSIVPLGFDGALVEVEGDKAEGLPCFNLVGLASKTVSEARERVRSALRASGFSFPTKKLTINLAPAELSKDGPHLDLPIALSVMLLSGQLSPEDVENSIFVGELSLEGRLRPVRGIINVVESARAHGFKRVFLPKPNLETAALVEDIELIGVESLQEAFLCLKGQLTPPITENAPSALVNAPEAILEESTVTIDHIRGQTLAKRVLEIAVAGRHNLLLSGPPGTGKTMLARSALSLLPPLSRDEQISVTKLHSLSSAAEVHLSPPFRSPHHTASSTSIIGGGKNALPGEISLAHRGILFLDELPEFGKNVLESLRQPLEDKQVTISRANLKVTYPADFLLIATMNPCPCGYLEDPHRPCTCTEAQIQSYQKKLSGPLLDRIDLFLNVERIDPKDLLKSPTGSSLQNIVKNNITEAIAAQAQRRIRNCDLTAHQISTSCNLEKPAKDLLDAASKKLSLSARSYLKTLRVARTIADLGSSAQILPEHVSEALTYRKR